LSEHHLKLGPASIFKHDHPPVRNPLVEHEAEIPLGVRIADRVALIVGSWPFIIIQSFMLVTWMAANAYLALEAHRNPSFFKAWDPYPFILLNLVLSFQAAYTGPVVMMSQNRQSEKDRLMAQNDYEVNQKAEKEICVIMDHLTHQDQLLLEAIQRLEAVKGPPTVKDVSDRIEDILKRMEQNDARFLRLLEKIEGNESVEIPPLQLGE
jgi:uncharacterized membrane protein